MKSISRIPSTSIHINKLVVVSFFAAFILSLIPALTMGGDYWAETFSEYFDTVKGIRHILYPGWAGYISLLPQFVAGIYNEFFSFFGYQWYIARFVSSAVIFCVSFSLFIEISALRNGLLKYSVFFVVFGGMFISILHPSGSSIISVGYLLYIPLLYNIVFSLFQKNIKPKFIIKFFFILGLLTKPSFLVLTLFGDKRLSWSFKIFCFLIFVAQTYLVNSEGMYSIQGVAKSYDFFEMICHVLNISGIFTSRLILLQGFMNYTVFIASISFVFLIVFIILNFYNFSKNINLLYTYGSTYIALIAPFFFASAGFGDSIEGAKQFILSFAKIQYWTPVVLLIPTFTLLSLKKFRTIYLIMFLLFSFSLLKLALYNFKYSQSSNVSNKIMIANEIPMSKYWRCFPVTPLPGFQLNELSLYSYGKDKDRIATMNIWLSGGCKSWKQFRSHSSSGFLIETENHMNIDAGLSYNYLIMVDSPVKNKISLERSKKCLRLYGNSHYFSYAESISTFTYIAGWVESPLYATNTDSLVNGINSCFSLSLDRNKKNLMLFFPDRK